jgi:hypothetical protein
VISTPIYQPEVPVANPAIFNFFDNSRPQEPAYNNIVIPVVEVLGAG